MGTRLVHFVLLLFINLGYSAKKSIILSILMIKYKIGFIVNVVRFTKWSMCGFINWWRDTGEDRVIKYGGYVW